jgi:hypothetical protein
MEKGCPGVGAEVSAVKVVEEPWVVTVVVMLVVLVGPISSAKDVDVVMVGVVVGISAVDVVVLDAASSTVVVLETLS